MKHYPERDQFRDRASITIGVILGALVGFALHFQHFAKYEPLAGNPFLHGLIEIGGSALAGAILLPLITAAFRWIKRRVQRG